MRVLLHTPLKPIDHPVPSGDREMARGFARLLKRLGHKVVMPALSRVPAGVPAPDTHLALQRRARAQAAQLVARWHRLPKRHPERFDLWFTYHCYYRKPDWLGPLVSEKLGIPYVIAEASHAPRRAQGPTRPGHRSVERALAAAHLVVTVNPRDIAGVRSCLRPGSQARVARQVFVPPFIDVRPFAAAGAIRKPNEVPVLLAVGMMRTRDKLESYRVLAKALHFLGNRQWRAVLVGDGPARPEVERLMTPFAGRIEFAGAVPRQALPSYYASADLFVWPAINEAYGMAFLEAQASGLPVVAGCTGGVPAVVADGRTGRLTPIGDVAAFAAAMTDLLDHPQERARLGANAAFRIAARHDDQVACHLLDCALKSLPFRIPS